MTAVPLSGKGEVMKARELIENVVAVMFVGALVFSLIAIATSFPMIKEYLSAFVISIRNWIW
jgi:hypothetical protein